ncbi:hypothetical protein [Gordonia sp. (in: high G+C Gram-positive bacteria)]
MRKTVSTVAALAVAGVVLSGCAREVAGAPVTDVGAAGAVTITGGGTQITPAKVSSVTCAPVRPLTDDAWCDTSSVTARDIPAGSTITVKPGDAIRFVGGVPSWTRSASATDRICTIAAFASDGRDTWALSGDHCTDADSDGRKGWKPKSGATASTVDGYRLGDVTAILNDPNGVSAGPGNMWTVPAVKLGANVRIAATFTGVTAPEAGSPVDVRGAASGPITGLSASMVSGGLTWKGEGAEPKIALGDLGAPATQGGKFVGITSGQAAVSMSLLTPDKLTPALAKLGANAKIATQ